MSSLIATINRDSAGWMKGIKASVATEPQRAVWPVQTVPDQADNHFAHMPGFASDMTVMLLRKRDISTPQPSALSLSCLNTAACAGDTMRR
jgi:hypothetical protein